MEFRKIAWSALVGTVLLGGLVIGCGPVEPMGDPADAGVADAGVMEDPCAHVDCGNGFCFVEDDGEPACSCPVGYEDDGLYCARVYTCSGFVTCSQAWYDTQCENRGCRWQDEKCEGVANDPTVACSSIEFQSSCRYEGCRWTAEDCEGVARQCSSYTEAAGCIQAGCNWD